VQHPPSDLPDGTVAELVTLSWGIPVARATYLPLGFGSHHWCVTDSGGVRWFVTADTVVDESGLAALRGAFSVAAAAVAAGVRGVHAAVPSADGSGVVVSRGGWALSVHAWLDGPAGRFGDRWADDEASALVDLLVGVHGVPASDVAAVAEDSSVPGLVDLLAVVDAVRAGRVPEGVPLGAGAGGAPLGPLAPVVLDGVRLRVRAVEAAVAALDDVRPGGGLVPTHGEPHPGNVVRTQGGPVLVDWETARLAEPERDLWLVAARTDLDVVAQYTERSGRRVDVARLRTRALRWSVADVAGFVAALLAAPEETPDTAWQLQALLGTLDEL
jgi:spectinomycin phosphotransferase